jgi:hypothetical protein
MKFLSVVLTAFCIMLSSCLYNISKEDIKTPLDTVKTLQWVLNRIEKDYFIFHFEELFTGKGKDIAKKFDKLKNSSENEEKALWVKLKEMFKNVIIRHDRTLVKINTAEVYCSYYFPDNYFSKKVKIIMEKTSDGWQIVSISP